GIHPPRPRRPGRLRGGPPGWRRSSCSWWEPFGACAVAVIGSAGEKLKSSRVVGVNLERGSSQGNAGPPQVFLTPSGGGNVEDVSWGRSEGLPVVVCGRCLGDRLC